MLFSFSFNGIKKPYMKAEKGKRRSAFAPIKRNLLTIPGLAGALLESTDTEVRVITQPIFIEGADRFDVRKVEEDLASWLITDKQVELIFDDEPDRVYHAIVNGSLDLEDIANYGRGTITFVCLDPYKYGVEKEISFTNAASFTVEGTVETEPIIEVTLKKKTEYVAVANSEKLNMVGFPAKQEQTAISPETSVFVTSGQTLTGWTVAAEPSLGGIPLGGTLKTNGDRLYTDDYGTNATQWHGPAMKTSLLEAIQDFRFDVGLRMRKTAANQCAAIRVSLLDASSISICNIEMTKHYGGVDTLYPQVLAKGNVVLPESQGQVNGNFGGVFRVYRRGNKFTATMWLIRDADGVWVKLAETSWIDTSNLASAKVTQVQVRLLQRASYPVAEQWIDEIQVFRLNNLSETQVPIIGKIADFITFDHKNDNILRNGESIIDEKAFIGDYFKLQPGQNSIVAEPADAIQSVKVRYLPKWR